MRSAGGGVPEVRSLPFAGSAVSSRRGRDVPHGDVLAVWCLRAARPPNGTGGHPGPPHQTYRVAKSWSSAGSVRSRSSVSVAWPGT
jgi:hypothetical protein